MTTATAFSPGFNATLAVSTATSRVAVTGTGSTLRLANVTTVECFVAIGDSAVNAAISDFSVPGNTAILLAIPNTATYVAAITAATTTTLRISRGEGG
jgi:hypothetical protein